MTVPVPAVLPVTVIGFAVLPVRLTLPLAAHVPPAVLELSEVVNPWQTAALPVIGLGTGLAFIVVVAVALKPLASVTVTVYTVTVAVGVATTLIPVLADKVDAGAHV